MFPNLEWKNDILMDSVFITLIYLIGMVNDAVDKLLRCMYAELQETSCFVALQMRSTAQRCFQMGGNWLIIYTASMVTCGTGTSSVLIRMRRCFLLEENNSTGLNGNYHDIGMLYIGQQRYKLLDAPRDGSCFHHSFSCMPQPFLGDKHHLLMLQR